MGKPNENTYRRIKRWFNAITSEQVRGIRQDRFDREMIRGHRLYDLISLEILHETKKQNKVFYCALSVQILILIFVIISAFKN